MASAASINFPPLASVPSPALVAAAAGGGGGGGQHGNNSNNGSNGKLNRPEPTQQEVFEMQIARFNEYIHHITLHSEVDMSPEEKRQHLQEHVPIDRFRDAVYDIFGDDVKLDYIKPLYRKISANPDCDVDWSEVFGYGGSVADDTAQRRAQEKANQPGEETIDDDKVIVTKLRRQVADAAGYGSKRRDIVKQIQYVPQVDCYIMASQHGFVQVLSAGKYATISSIQVQPGDQLTSGCCFLPNLRRLAVATDRQITIWDYRSPTKESFVITPFPTNILCIAAITSEGIDNNQFEDALLFGDVEGCVGIVRINQKDLSVKSPHKKTVVASDDRSNDPTSNGPKRDMGLVHIVDIARLATPMIRKKVHADWTVKVMHCPDLKMFASCSPSSKTSFIAEDLTSLKSERPYARYVSIDKGCNAFTYSDRSNIFVTGGADKILRIWHPGIYSKPGGKLYGHIFSIVDIAINDADQHIVSLSSARLIRVWDIHTLTALQVFGDNENRPGERRIHCMIYDVRNEVLLTGSSVVDEWPLARKYHATILVPQTHSYAVLCMAVNIPLGQLLTSDTTPQIRIWEIESGRLVAQLNNSHGDNVEVVAAAFDPTGFRMVTGGMNGSLRIWDFGSTQILKMYDPPLAGDDKSILDLHFYDKPALPNVNYIIALGWGGKMKIFRDASSELDLTELCDFSEPAFQERDMLFTPLIDDPDEARKSVAEKEREEQQQGIIKRKPQLLQLQQMLLLQKQKQQQQQRQNSATDTGSARARTPTSRNPSFYREKSVLEEMIRRRFNRGLLLLDDMRTVITGTGFGHLIAWDLRTMSMDVRWRLPATRKSSAGLNNAAGQKNVTSENYIPTPVSHTTMLDIPETELHRVNALMIVRPTLPEKPKKFNEDGQEISSSSDSDDDDDDLESIFSQSDDGGPMLSENEAIAENDRLPRLPSGIKTTKRKPESEVDSEDDEIRAAMLNAGDGVLYKQLVLLVSAHQDSWIRFWTMNKNPKLPNRVIYKAQMEINAYPSAVTCICADSDSKFLAAGDYRGFVCTWTMQLAVPTAVKKAAKSSRNGSAAAPAPGSAAAVRLRSGRPIGSAAPYFSLKFKVSWRAHNIKIEEIFYYKPLDILLTASMDSSVRIWKGFSSKYLGFFGQPQPFAHTGKHYGPLTMPLLPDIDDKPVFPAISEKVLERKRAARKIRDLPLIVDRSRWNRGGSGKDPAKKRYWQPKHVKDQYFNLLVKPNVHSRTGEKGSGGAASIAGSMLPRRPADKAGIYRSLITYGVVSTEHVHPRTIDFTIVDK